ncbi:alpha/beta fold hydrolase [Acinetobacter oleivorans]|uniref:alpha/beta fold hydrolase n=1 Tax=Acinetobacter oleivorans TaxID=1148157 RepID=UPI003A880601
MNTNIEKQQRYIQSADVTLSIYEWGTAADNRETLVFIHGYPDEAQIWDELASLLKSDFHIVTYDVRGTGLSGTPLSDAGYHMDYLISDLKTVIEQTSPQQPVHLIGHDLGALQGWEAILDDKLKPYIKSYTALAPSIDHAGMWFKENLNSKELARKFAAIKQMISSSYMLFFNIPIIPELSWYLGLSKIWPQVVSQLEGKKVNPHPHQLKNAVRGLGFYRLNLFKPLINSKKRYTSVPVHVLSMTKDRFVPQHIVDKQDRWVNSSFTRTDIHAGHWGIASHPDLIAMPIRNYIQKLTA